MRVSTEICSAAKIVGYEKAVELYARAGFDAYDLSLFEMAKVDWDKGCIAESDHPFAKSARDALAFTKRIKQVAADNGIHCNQSHAPFPARVVPVDLIKRAIECTAEAGGKICIVHPDNDKTAEQNAEYYNELLPFAKEHGVKIATENMWNWKNGAKTSCFAACSTSEDFVKHIDTVNDSYLVACLDIGHAEMQGSGSGAYNMIKALDARLQALHIHDNDRLGDSHQIPFSMNIDFDKVAQGLKEINYSGYLTLEADRYLGDFDETNIEKGISNLYESVKRLDELIKSK